MEDIPGRYELKKGYDVRIVCYVKDKNRVFTSEESTYLHFYFIDSISISFYGFVEEFPCFLNLKDLIVLGFGYFRLKETGS